MKICDENEDNNTYKISDIYTTILEDKRFINFKIILSFFFLFCLLCLKKRSNLKKIFVLFSEEIIINNVKFKIRNIIFMPSINHYTIG